MDPALSKQLSQEAQAKGCQVFYLLGNFETSWVSAQFVDAPVSGGINAASAGTLTFMVSDNLYIMLKFPCFYFLQGGSRV